MIKTVSALYHLSKQEIAYQLSKFIPVKIKIGPAQGLKIYGNLFYNRRMRELSLTEKIYDSLDMSQFTMVEVGSHIGEYAIYFGKYKSVKKMILIEPNPLNCYFIKKNMSINKIPSYSYTLLNIGLGHQNAELLFVSDRYNRSKGTFVNEKQNYLIKTKKKILFKSIPVKTGDEILKNESQIDYIKIDTEGFETQVISGITQTIKMHSPIIEFEVHGSTNEQKIGDLTFLYHFLDKLGYKIYKIDRDFPQLTNTNLHTLYNGGFIAYKTIKSNIEQVINDLKKYELL